MASDSPLKDQPIFGDEYVPGRLLYHYTRAETALGAILPTQSLRLSPFRWMNDPRESKAMLDSVAGDTVTANVNVIDVFERARGHLQDHTKLVAFTLDRAPVYPTERFSRGFSRARMWAMYSGHSGVCLIFDREKLDAAFQAGLTGLEFVRSGTVHYSDLDPFPPPLDVVLIQEKGIDAALKQYINQNWQTLFLRKNSDWEGEAEYRWIVREGSLGPIFLPYRDAVVAVVAGQDISDPNLAMLVHYMEQHGVTGEFVARMWWRNGYPVVVPAV
jgi:hypothetical protein